MIPLRYSTAGQEISLGHFVDSTDGDTEEVGLTIANTDIQIWKSGATSLVSKNSGGATHMANGVYYCVLDATDTGTYGPLVIYVHVAGALAVVVRCIVMETNAYDALYSALGTGSIEADMVAISGDTVAADNAELDYDGTGYNKTNSTIGTVTANTDMLTSAAIWNDVVANYPTAGSTGKALYDASVSGGGGGSLQQLTKTATSLVVGTTTGGSDADIDEDDGVTWDIAESTGSINVEIHFDLTNLYPAQIDVWAGLVSHQADYLAIEAYNEGNVAWEEVSTEGTRINPNVGITRSSILVGSEYVDSGNLLKIRLVGGMRQSSTLSIDAALTIANSDNSYVLTAAEVADATVRRMVNATYQNTVFLDTVNGADPTNVTLGETGTPRFPLLTLTEAVSLADSLGKAQIWVTRNSEITLTSALDHTLVNDLAGAGNKWLLHLGTQDISNSVISGAEVDGTFLASGNNAIFHKCDLFVITGPEIIASDCVIGGNLTVNSSGNIVLADCVSVQDQASAAITLQDSASDIYALSFEGALTINGMQAGNTAEINGSGTLVIDVSCTGGSIKIEGNWQITDNSGSVTVVDDSNFDKVTLIPEQSTHLWNTQTPRALTESVDVGSVNSTPVTSPNDFKADVSALATQASVDLIPTNPLLTNDARLDNLDATISSRATQASVSAIPTNPLLTNDVRLDNLNAPIGSIPTNPLLTNDVRLDNLDATISSRATQVSVNDIPTNAEMDTKLAGLNDLTELEVENAVWDALQADHTTPLTTGDSLNNAGGGSSPSAIADAVWLEILSDHSGTAGSAAEALANAGAAANPWIDNLLSYSAGQAGYIVLNMLNAPVGSIPTNPLLTNDARLDNLDATISSRATQASVSAIPVNPLLTNDVRLDNLNAPVGSIPTNPLLTNDARLDNLDATISSRATQASVSAIPTNPLLTTDIRLNNLDAPISAIPTNPLLTTDIRLDNLDVTIGSRATQVSVDDIPTNAEMDAKLGALNDLTASEIVSAMDADSTRLLEIVTDTNQLNDVPLPDSIPALGSIPTLKQAMYINTQFLLERVVVGTTTTVNKANGTTPLLTLSLNDAVQPTSITRAT